jgi:superfamily II DNA or RNA helicase
LQPQPIHDAELRASVFAQQIISNVIPKHIASAFPLDVRGRGDGYTGRVTIEGATPEGLVATVRGTDSYAVKLRAEPDLLEVRCTCPYAIDNGICKHIWATLKKADAEGTLGPILETAGREAELIDASGLSDAARPIERATAPLPEWKALLDSARRQMAQVPAEPESTTWPADRRIVYIVDLSAMWTGGIKIDLATERQTSDGTWEAPVAFRLSTSAWQTAPDPKDRQIAQMLIGATPAVMFDAPRTSGFLLRDAALDITLSLMCETGRCRARLRPGERPLETIRFESGSPWTLGLRVVRRNDHECFLDTVLRRGGEEMLLSEPAALHPEGLLLARGSLARWEPTGAYPLVPLFREKSAVVVPDEELPSFLETVYALPRRPALELPPDIHVTEVRTPPKPGVTILPDPTTWRRTHHRLAPFFLYGNVRVMDDRWDAPVFDRESLTVRHRDRELERAARALLVKLGARDEWSFGDRSTSLTIHDPKLGPLIVELATAGWRVEADGTFYRTPGQARASVRSGIDWFELDADVRYGDVDVSLQELLAARRTGAATIILADGTRGIIPLDWLARLGPLAAGGKVVNGALRYARSQTALLDALLATLPEATADETFEKARAELQSFDRVAPADPPRTFHGSLREYQREGLGWLHFLRTFGLGGCLADDMGLGKTVQVLALLDSRRGTPKAPSRPSIVVVPRSLVFNWLREAERFTPKLRMLDFTGTGRTLDAIDSAHIDVVITTYGTLRRDAAQLSGIRFDYAILDEAQAIKTAGSASAKATRLLKADHRLAMTGTPIENRLEELWSLFEFLNPGMLGASPTFAALARLTSPDDPAIGHDVLARALKPVILRRTKDQVARELPPRVEQTLHVELEGAQRKFYDELLEAYRQSVLERVDRVGIAKARMHILEALLRLRQAACHPVLADPRKTSAPSAKLDALMPALEEVMAEGHKALVFSQFTSLLALVRERLDAAKVTYEYLDGRVRDRQARVDRFQTDPACPLFLISLKAGGHGLNLTAAGYVFVLDPWWNPAVEAQAIDRAHRIGQTKRVIATRIVARDTIEEKILQLQASKRALADAILGQDQGALSRIGPEELRLLLG